MNNNRLKSCPFCGGEAELYQTYNGCYQVECHKCGARSCIEKKKENVISKWNERTTTIIINQNGSNCTSIGNAGTVNIKH